MDRTRTLDHSKQFILDMGHELDALGQRGEQSWGGRRVWIAHKLNIAVERFVLWATSRQRLTDTYEIIEDPPAAYALEMLFCTARAIQQVAIEPVLFPGINAHCGVPDPEEKQRRFDNVVKASRRSLLLFLLAYSWYASVVAEALRRFVYSASERLGIPRDF